MGEESTKMEEWQNRVQQDITEIKQRQSENEGRLSKVVSDVHKLEISDQLQDKEINTLKTHLGEIKADTGFIRERMDKDREEQLRQYKNTTWKVVGAILVAGALTFLGLN